MASSQRLAGSGPADTLEIRDGTVKERRARAVWDGRHGVGIALSRASTSDNDEVCALAVMAAADLTGDAG